jgi:hypothetical protein
MNSLVHILSVASVSLVLFGAPVLAEESSIIEPNKTEASEVLTELRSARAADLANAHSWSAEDNSVDHFYGKKAREVDHLIQQLKQGQPVARADIKRALNNRRSGDYAPIY